MLDDMNELANKTFIITGANTGIGKITATELAREGAHVILACRSKDKTEPVIDEIKRTTGNSNVEFVAVDLSDLGSVRACAESLLARDIPIHGLINNAGMAGQRGLTKDGFELTFATNHLGHYLFTRLLLDRIKKTGGARIINVSSTAHYSVKGIDWGALKEKTRSVTGMHEYAVSKLSNVLFTKELARRLDGSAVTTYAVHPGVAATDVWRKVPRPFRWIMKKFMITPEQGAAASIRCKEKKPNHLADDAELARELWQKSAEWTGLSA